MINYSFASTYFSSPRGVIWDSICLFWFLPFPVWGLFSLARPSTVAWRQDFSFPFSMLMVAGYFCCVVMDSTRTTWSGQSTDWWHSAEDGCINKNSNSFYIAPVWNTFQCLTNRVLPVFDVWVWVWVLCTLVCSILPKVMSLALMFVETNRALTCQRGVHWHIGTWTGKCKHCGSSTWRWIWKCRNF